MDPIKTFNFYSCDGRIMMKAYLTQETEMSQIRMHKKGNFIVHYVIEFFRK